MDELTPVVDATIFEGFPPCVNKSLFRYCTVGISERLKAKRYFVQFNSEKGNARIETTDPQIIDSIKEIFNVSSQKMQIRKEDLIEEQKRLVLGRSLASVERCEQAFARDGVCSVEIVASSSDSKSPSAIISFLHSVFSRIVFSQVDEHIKVIIPQRFLTAVTEAFLHDQISFGSARPKIEVIEARSGKNNLPYRVKLRLVLGKAACLELINSTQALATPPFFGVKPVATTAEPCCNTSKDRFAEIPKL